MAVRNGPRHVAEAVTSALGQSLADTEVLVVDDASDDGTPAVLAGLAAADPRLRVLTLARRVGPPAAYDVARSQARGRYVALLDHDDRCHADRLARQVAALDAEPSWGAVGCLVEAIDDGGARLPARPAPAHGGATSPAAVRWVLPFHTPVLRSGLMVRRTLLDRIGGFATRRPYADDYELCARLAAAAPLANVPAALIQHRRHDTQITRTAWRGQRAAVLLLQQQLVWQRLGTVTPLEVLAAILLVRAERPPRPEPGVPAAAVAVCERLHAAFMAAGDLDGPDRAWVDADHAERISRLSAPAAPAPVRAAAG